MVSRLKKHNSYTKYVLLLIIIPGLILIGMSIISIGKQKASRILYLNEELSNKTDAAVEKIEKDIENSFKETLLDIKESKDFGNPALRTYISLIKQLMLKNPIITYPFIIDDKGRYLFPTPQTKNIKKTFLTKLSKMTALEKLANSNQKIDEYYRIGQNYEFGGQKKYLLAIKSYLKILNKITDPLIKIEILYAISRCYRGNENYIQAIAYLDDITKIFKKEKINDHFMEFKVLSDNADCYNLLGHKTESINIYIDLYDRILNFEKLTNRNDYASIKSGVRDYLENNIGNKKKSREDFEKMKKDDRFDAESELSRTNLDLMYALRGQTPEDLNRISRNNRFRLNRIRELYISSDEKTVYYTKLLNSEMWLEKQNDVMSINTKIIEKNKEKVTIIYSKILSNKSDQSIYFGYYISKQKVNSQFLPPVALGYFKTNDLSLQIDNIDNTPNLTNIVAVKGFKKFLPNSKLYIISNKENYVDIMIENELFINYLTIVFLLLILILGLSFFIRIFNKERNLVRMKSDFVDSVSHTLKTPLTRIRLISEKLELGWTKDTRSKEEALRVIQTETDLMAETIENMLNFSKIDSGKFLYNKNSLDISSYLNELVDNYKSYLHSKDFTLELNISPNIPIIYFDREAFKMIFINLMQNSIKYSTDTKKIRIDLSHTNNKIIFTLSDRGMGIPPKHIKSVFDKFFRADDNLVKTIEGSGLGLFLVLHAVIEHKGKISIENRTGGGIEVTIIIPILEKIKK